MNRKSSLRTGLAALVLAVAAGCSAQYAGPPSVGAGGRSTPSPLATRAVPSPMSEPKPVSFGQKYRFANGLVMSVTGIAHGKLGEFPATDDPKAKKGDPYTVITITLHNDGAKTVECVLNGTVFYGKDQRRAYRFDVHGGVPYPTDATSTPTIAAGETAPPHDMGFLIPVADRGQVRLQVTIDAGLEQTAYFAGSIAD
jgi:hypothetical protein